MADVRIDFGFDDLDKASKVLKEMQKAAKALRESMKKTGTVLETDLQKAKQFASATKKISTEKKKLTAVEKEQLRLERALAATEAKITLATKSTNKALIQKRKQLLDINRELRTGSKNTATWGKALGSFQFKFNALGNIAANVASRVQQSISRAMRDAVRVVVDFDQAMADVKAITGATGKELDDLSNSAQQLGRVTKFTATEVAKLQKEYAKLGFSTKEILKAEAATLALAAATNEELPRAAEVVGITIRQFGLDASEAGRVTDVMAKAFTSSALDMNKFAESMKFVGPAAKAAGLSLEETTARLAQMADAGIAGSLGGTALRQIFIAMAVDGKEATKRIKELSLSQLGLAEASAEVQKRAATALLVLADGADTVDAFTESLEGAAGAAQSMADVQLDTIAGQATLVKSAWEGMVLAMLSTEENLTGVKWALGGIVTLLNALATRAETGISLSNALLIERNVKDALEFATNQMEHQLITTDQMKVGWVSIKGAIKDIGIGIWQKVFPSDEADEVLENIDGIVKKLDEFRFKEEDQDVPFFNPQTTEIAENFKDDYVDIINDLSANQAAAIAADIAASIEAEKIKMEAIKDAEDKKQAIISASFAIAGNAANAFANLIESNKQKELSAAGQNAKERERIEIEYAKKQQAIAISQIAIHTAVAAARALDGPPIWKWIEFGAVIASGLAQASIAKNQKFAEGEIDIRGASHSRGGIAAEIEGGESVINKRSTSKYKGLLEAINQDDQTRIMDAMARDRKITLNGSGDPYNRKIYELMRSQERYGEDNEYYIQHKGNRTLKIRKN